MGRLMKAGADVNAGDYDKRRPLHIAAAEINLPAVRAVGAAVELNPSELHLCLWACSCCCLQATWPDGGTAEVLLVSLGAKCHCCDLARAAAVQATKVASAEGRSASGLCSMRNCTCQGLPQMGPLICMLRLCADQDAGGAGQGRSECEGPLGPDPPGGGNKEQRQQACGISALKVLVIVPQEPQQDCGQACWGGPSVSIETPLLLALLYLLCCI